MGEGPAIFKKMGRLPANAEVGTPVCAPVWQAERIEISCRSNRGSHAGPLLPVRTNAAYGRLLQRCAGLQGFGFSEESVDDFTGCGQIGAAIHSGGQVVTEEQPFVAPGEEQPEPRQLLLRQEPLFQLITKVV